MDFPIRQDITVIPGDSGPLELEFKIYLRLGVPIHPPEKPDETITGRDTLKVGQKVWLPGMFGGYHEAVVTNEKWAESEHMMFVLEYEEPFNEWVCTGYINNKAIELINFD